MLSLATRRVISTRWDAITLGRALLLAAVVLGLVLLITAVSDEGGVSWLQRAGRTLPLSPVCAAVGAWGALAPARARGETLALGALGRSTGEIARPAVAGGALVAFAAALAVVVLPSVDVEGFFPTAAHASAWHWQEDGETAFVDRALGLQVGADGAPLRIASPAEAAGFAPVPAHGRAAAAISTALAGMALPMLLANWVLGDRHKRAGGAGGALVPTSALIAVGLASAASIMLFQAAALRQAPALLGPLPWAVLLAFAAQRYRTAP
jgi:hypothetical protein